MNQAMTLRAVELAIILLLAAIVGVCTGVLTWLDHGRPAAAVLRGAAGFGAVVALGITVTGFLRG
jgi:hypothetical protein